MMGVGSCASRCWLFYLTLMRAKHGGVPQAATGLSEAKEEAERTASPGTRLGLLFCARKNLLSIYRFHYILLYLFFEVYYGRRKI